MKKYCWFIFLLILIGCSPHPIAGTASVTPVLSLTPTIESTATKPVVPVTVTQTATSTFTPTPTTIPAQPIATPSAKEKTEITLELLRTNNGCALPCWWGITPNKTSWKDAEKFLKPFSTIYERQPPSEWFVYDVRSPISEQYSELGTIETVVAVRDGIVKEIEIEGIDESPYFLSSILLKYGAPSQVLVSTYSSDSGLPPNQVFLSVDIHYAKKGINVLYGSLASVSGGEIKGCLKNPHLFLWSPQEADRSIDYILGWNKHKTPYLSIEKATDLDIDAFYEKYSNPVVAPCLGTPKNLWPGQ